MYVYVYILFTLTTPVPIVCNRFVLVFLWWCDDDDDEKLSLSNVGTAEYRRPLERLDKNDSIPRLLDMLWEICVCVCCM